MFSEALEQLCMENTQILPWIWVVEALSSSMSVDTSLLIQLAKIIPEKYGEMGKNAREAVSLRILESLAARDVEDNDGIPDERIEFDPSESCEDVLQHILDDVPASYVENGGLKMFKWDVRSFIAGKRAHSNSSFLQKLKEAILEGNHSVLESFKERSGIEVRTQYNNNILANDGHSDELVPRLEDVVSSKTSNLVSSAEKGDDEMQENIPERNILPAKRNRSHVTAENAERRTYDLITTEDCCDLEREAAKKHKKGEDCPRHDNICVTMTSSQYEIPIKPLENLVENVETEIHRLDKEAEVVESPNNVEDQEESLRIPENPVVKDIRRNLYGQMLGQNDKICEGYERITSKDTLLPVDEAIKFIHEYRATDAAETNDHIELDQDPEATTNSDDYHDETNDVNLQKDAFLSSQCPFSQDSLATQLKLCMKCNNGGKLLVCSSDTCPIVVHESCLGSTANLNCEDRFYCPFCAYSRAISEYLEVRKRATLARRKLAIFIGQKSGSDKSNVNESKRAFLTGINHMNHGSNLEDRRKTKPGDKPLCKKIVKESAVHVEARHDPIETFEDESDQSVASTYSQRSTKTQNLHTNGGVPQTRNKEKLPWTNAEVEKLKEGVEKFRYADGMIPWIMILEYGADVFHKCRGRINLKHKWRAMNRISPIKR